jgi:hypothetical protein
VPVYFTVQPGGAYLSQGARAEDAAVRLHWGDFGGSPPPPPTAPSRPGSWAAATATRLPMLWSIVLPLSQPALAAMALLVFLNA